MDGVEDLVINIAAAVIVFVCGAGARELLTYARSWRGRVFWGRKILRGRTVLFQGAFTRFNHLEPSSFIGVGDNHAVQLLATTLGHLGARFDIAYTSQMSEGQHRENLILVGSDEVNSLTPSVFDKIGSGFRVDIDAMTIEDVATGDLYGSVWDAEPMDSLAGRDLDESWFISTAPDGTRTARRFRVDYGILVRGQNPFAPERALIVLAGLYGFGTWAGATLPLDAEFLRRCAGLRNFECLYRVEVHQGQLLATSVVALRPLPEIPIAISHPLPRGLARLGIRSGSRPPYGPGGSPRGATAGDRHAG